MSQRTRARRIAQDPDRVYRARLRAGLSQRGLAARCQLSDAQVCRIETGVSGASAEALHRLAVALGCDVEDLMVPAEDSEPSATEATAETAARP